MGVYPITIERAIAGINPHLVFISLAGHRCAPLQITCDAARLQAIPHPCACDLQSKCKNQKPLKQEQMHWLWFTSKTKSKTRDCGIAGAEKIPETRQKKHL